MQLKTVTLLSKTLLKIALQNIAVLLRLPLLIQQLFSAWKNEIKSLQLWTVGGLYSPSPFPRSCDPANGQWLFLAERPLAVANRTVRTA